MPFDDGDLYPGQMGLGGLSHTHVECRLERRQDLPDNPYPLGTAGATRLELGGVLLRGFFDARKSWSGHALELGFEAPARKGVLVVGAGEGDGFVRKLLGERDPRLDFALGLGFARGRGWYLTGGTGLALTVPVNRRLPGLEIESLTLALAPTAQGQASGAALDLGALVLTLTGPRAAPLAGQTRDGPAGGRDSAHMAVILLQTPVQAAIHARALLPPR